MLNNKFRKYPLIGCLFLCTWIWNPSVKGQEKLSLPQVIDLALEQNYDILKMANEMEMAANNATPGNAGLLPEINLQGGSDFQQSRTQLEFAGDIPPIDQAGAVSINNNAALNVNYVLYQGGQRMKNYEMLKTLHRSGLLAYQVQMETIIQAVATQYLDIVRLKGQLEVRERAIDISLDRLKRTERAYEFGGDNKVEVLSAEVDLNNDSMSLANMQVEFRNAKRALNVLLGRAVEEDFDVEDEIDFNEKLNLNALLDKAEDNNRSLIMAKLSMEIADFEVSIAKSNRMPVIDLNGGYQINRSDNDAGIILTQQNNGYNVGAGLRFNLFNGRQVQIGIQNAKLALENQKFEQEQLRLEVTRDLRNAFDIYQNNLKLLQLEERNLVTARLNFERMESLFQLGQATNTQFREAQLNLLQSKDSIQERRYQIKLNEYELLRLSAGLLPD